MFRIVLCDDSPADLMVLCGHLEQLKEKRPVDIISYTDGLDLLKDYKQKGFCDILYRKAGGERRLSVRRGGAA